MTHLELQEQIQMLRDNYPAKLKAWGNYDAAKWFDTQAFKIINQHVKEILGEDETSVEYGEHKVGDYVRGYADEERLYTRNELRAEQRKRAGL